LRSGQAKHATTLHDTPTKVTPPPPPQIPPPPTTSNNNNNNNNNPVASPPREQPPNPPAPAPGTEHQPDQVIVDIEEEIIEEIEEAELKFEEVAQEELIDSEEKIVSAIDQVVTMMSESLIGLFQLDGDDNVKNLVTAEDLATVGEELRVRLKAHVDATLFTQAEESVQEEEDELEIQADIEAEDIKATNEEEAEEFMSALGDEEKDLEEDLRERVDTSIDEALKALKSNAVTITKELLEALLEKKTGTSYVVYFDNDGNLTEFKKQADSDSSPTNGGGGDDNGDGDGDDDDDDDDGDDDDGDDGDDDDDDDDDDDGDSLLNISSR
jgi:hypothetical protein